MFWKAYQLGIVAVILLANDHYGWTHNIYAIGFLAAVAAFWLTLFPIAVWDSIRSLIARLSSTSVRGRPDKRVQERRDPSLWPTPQKRRRSDSWQ